MTQDKHQQLIDMENEARKDSDNDGFLPALLVTFLSFAIFGTIFGVWCVNQNGFLAIHLWLMTTVLLVLASVGALCAASASGNPARARGIIVGTIAGMILFCQLCSPF